MVNWKADPNSLIEETMALAKSVRVEPSMHQGIHSTLTAFGMIEWYAF